MRIALIGGAGFVGHNMAPALMVSGHEPFVIDSLLVNNAFGPAMPWHYLEMLNDRMNILDRMKIPVFLMDAREYTMMSPLIKRMGPDVLIHLAAVAHIDRANKNAFSTFDHSLRTLENSLDIARHLNIKHFIYFSSSTAYGDFKKQTIDETELCEPKGIYGSLKLAGELMVKAYGDVYGLPYTIIRPCALYGPRCISGRVTQKFIELALAGEALTIDGDGSGRHDFTYIQDLIDGILMVLRRKESIGEIFNITAGEARSIKELVEIIGQRIDVKFECGPFDPEKPSRGTMSVEKARRLLGWEPLYRLEAGMAEYIQWYRDFYGRIGYRPGQAAG